MCALVAAPREPQGRERERILLAVKPTVERALGGPILFQTRSIRADGKFCFLEFRPNRSRTVALDWSKTKFASIQSKESFMNEVMVLLKSEGTKWKIVAIDYGPSSDEWLGWPHKFGAPKSILPQ